MSKCSLSAVTAWVGIVMIVAPPAWAGESTVYSTGQLRSALLTASPGDRIYVAPGTYTSRLYVDGAHGAPGNLIEVVALDPNNRPVFESGGYGVFTLINSSYILVDGIIARGAGADTGDGNNIDIAQSHHMILKNSRSGTIPVPGNSDGIKFASSSNTLMYNNTIENWGSGGSGADMMNNHNSLFMRNTFSFPSMPGDTAGNGIQSKGSNAYENGFYKNVFNDGGNRAQKFGGWGGAGPSAWEARDMTAMGNVFVNGQAAVSFESATNCDFAYNTVVNPEKWVMRILQGGGKQTAYNSFRRNLVVYGPFQSYGGVQNISGGTRPETFTYEANYWYNNVNPSASIPSLVGGETDPAGGVDPQLDADYRPLYAGAEAYGAHAPAMEAEWANVTGRFQWAWDWARQFEPDADAGEGYSTAPGFSVALNAAGSTGGGGSYGAYAIDSWAWDLDGDGAFDDAAGPTAEVSYEMLTGTAPGQLGLSPGWHTVEVRVSATNERWETLVDYDRVQLLVLAQCLPGDANVDGLIGLADLAALTDNYGQWDAGWKQGDFTGDGLVGLADLAALADGYGTDYRPVPIPVPEPACTALLLLAAGAAALRPRRARQSVRPAARP